MSGALTVLVSDISLQLEEIQQNAIYSSEYTLNFTVQPITCTDTSYSIHEVCKISWDNSVREREGSEVGAITGEHYPITCGRFQIFINATWTLTETGAKMSLCTLPFPSWEMPSFSLCKDCCLPVDLKSKPSKCLKIENWREKKTLKKRKLIRKRYAP